MPTTSSIRQMTVDFSDPVGQIRALNGVNLGPLSMNGFLDLSQWHKQLKIPSTRLHDCPYAFADAVDVHCIFPNFDAEVDDPRSYRFMVTDDYIQSILDVGSQVVYRLGESIEHSKRHKYWIHPPADYEKWAEICIHIIRHYNEGWADGFRHGIRYWEIWNEPWNDDLQWTGPHQEWIRFYEVTAKIIKRACPDVLVGGPTLSALERLVGPKSFGELFLAHCRDTGAPLDFFSWHSYATTPREIPDWSHRLRELVNQYGFTQAEMHLNEWNYMRAGAWDPENFRATAGAEGASFAAATLCAMQDLPIDVANFYWAKEGWWGLFDDFGRPNKKFYALLAFARLLETPRRVRATGDRLDDGRAILAGLAEDGRCAGVLIANFADVSAATEVAFAHLPWGSSTRIEMAAVDETHDLDVLRTTSADGGQIVLREEIPPRSVVLYRLAAEGGESPAQPWPR